MTVEVPVRKGWSNRRRFDQPFRPPIPYLGLHSVDASESSANSVEKPEEKPNLIASLRNARYSHETELKAIPIGFDHFESFFLTLPFVFFTTRFTKSVAASSIALCFQPRLRPLASFNGSREKLIYVN